MSKPIDVGNMKPEQAHSPESWAKRLRVLKNLGVPAATIAAMNEHRNKPAKEVREQTIEMFKSFPKR